MSEFFFRLHQNIIKKRMHKNIDFFFTKKIEKKIYQKNLKKFAESHNLTKNV